MTSGTLTRDTSAGARVEVLAISPEDVKSILLSDGEWHDVRQCKLVQFSVSPAFSPPAPQKLYPALRFTEDDGHEATAPMSQIVAFSRDPKGYSGKR